MGGGLRVLGMGVRAPTMACLTRWTKKDGSLGKLPPSDSRWWTSTCSEASPLSAIALSRRQV